jgi:Activator of Hsp90 ATPase homolog 1-like protein
MPTLSVFTAFWPPSPIKCVALLGARRVRKVAATSVLYVHCASTGCERRWRALDVLWQLRTLENHSFGGKYVELVPNERSRYMDRFEEQNLLGEIQISMTLKPVTVGNELNVVQEGLPDVIPVQVSYLDWQNSLENLAKLVELEIYQ